MLLNGQQQQQQQNQGQVVKWPRAGIGQDMTRPAASYWLSPPTNDGC